MINLSPQFILFEFELTFFNLWCFYSKLNLIGYLFLRLIFEHLFADFIIKFILFLFCTFHSYFLGDLTFQLG